MDKQKDNNKIKHSISTLPATVILILVALLLVFLGYIYLALKSGYTFDDLIDNIVGNLLGVLAAFLLFDILYNKMTQDAYAKETSQQITKTLMGDPETMDSFNDEDKTKFFESTIRSIAKDEDAVDLICDNAKKYLKNIQNTRVRKGMNYTISLSTEFPKAYDEFPGVKEGKYFYVQENLSYDLKYINDKDNYLDTNIVNIGFAFDKKQLDRSLLESHENADFSRCIFSENLDITAEAVDYLHSLSNEDFKKTFEKLFTMVIKVDGKNGTLENVKLNADGIVASYNVPFDVTKKELSIKIIFHMPKLWNSIFEVVLVDPTKDPKITLDFFPGKMDVSMYSYLNKRAETNDAAYEQLNGLFDVTVRDEWILPKSGIVFNIKRKEEAN